VSDNAIARIADRNDPRVTRRLSQSAVGIAGCGGVGSNVAVALARVGVGRLVLVDHDVVEPSNLNRQHFYLEDIGRPKPEALSAWIARVNPRVRVAAIRRRIRGSDVQDLFSVCDVVVEAFDTVEDKTMIIDAFGAEEMQGRVLVCASGLSGIDSANRIRARRMAENVYVCGDLESDPAEERGVMAPRVMVAAGQQANTVVRVLCGMAEP
jgi:sulfur carrier protein ThiS adenylyltransferase